MIRSRSLRSALAVCVGAGLGLIMLGNFSAGAAPILVGKDAHLPAPTVALDGARNAAPYAVREPGWLPEGMELFLVNHVAPSAPEEVAHSVDMWFKDGNGGGVHVWQTDHRELAAAGKDPSAATAGTATMIRGRVWQFVEVPDFHAASLSVRFEDGVTVSIDSNLGRDVLTRIASSFD